jgi:putative membrane protein
MQQAILAKCRFLLKTVTYVGWSLFWLLIWDIIVTVDFMLFLERKISLPSMPLTLLGSALVVLTSFRNSSAYNRWWEARTLWGSLVNNSRSYARQVLTLVEDGHTLNPLKAVLLRRHVAFVKCLSAHLKKKSVRRTLLNWSGKRTLPVDTRPTTIPMTCSMDRRPC